MRPVDDEVLNELSALREQVARMENKLDEVLAFTAATTEAVAPFLSGKGAKWLALVAKTKGRT